MSGYEGLGSDAYHLQTAYNYFKPMYFQALGATINVINDWFEKPALKKFMNVE